MSLLDDSACEHERTTGGFSFILAAGPFQYAAARRSQKISMPILRANISFGCHHVVEPACLEQPITPPRFGHYFLMIFAAAIAADAFGLRRDIGL